MPGTVGRRPSTRRRAAPVRTPARTPPRYLVRFGYDGEGFAGWARQPGRRTIEGEILVGLGRMGITGSDGPPTVEVASRTDRGVSARGNALVLRSPLPPASLLRALNGASPGVWFTDLAKVPERFRVRSAIDRTYRYWERAARSVPAVWRDAARILTGPIDARSFGRGVPPQAPRFRRVTLVRPRIDLGWLVLEVRGRSFEWGMVRKLVAGIREVEAGRLPLAELRSAVRGRRRLTLPMAEPERLVLWEVRHGVRWTHHTLGPATRRDLALRAAEQAASARVAILPQIHPETPYRGP
jgi:tRNA pseudouridine38-40 synthase